MHYTVRLNANDTTATVTLALSQPSALLRELSFDVQSCDQLIGGDGTHDCEALRVTWSPPASGGELTWTVPLEHRRSQSGFDALITERWGVFRGEDIIPRARTRTLRGAASATRLAFDLPAEWSVVTPYPSHDGVFIVDHKDRRLDEPRGWMIVGELGVRRESIAGVQVAVAAPQGADVRRLDTLALLNWGIPEIANFVVDMPDRITVISAADPMWRGGLSAPQSLYIHADRPMISENGSSTLLHEIMHVALGIRGRDGYDWIVEGIAEFYSIELLRRSGTITERRYERAMQRQQSWSKDADILCRTTSKGATTALAVTVFAELDQQIREATDHNVTLDDVTAQLADTSKVVDLAQLRAVVRNLAGTDLDALADDNLAGCNSYD